MKYFFWLSALLYVAVYFYAAWIYDGFSMPVAIIIFVLVFGFCYWRYKRHIAAAAQQQLTQQTSSAAPIDRPTLSFWRSPIPYIAVLGAVAIVIAVRL